MAEFASKFGRNLLTKRLSIDSARVLVHPPSGYESAGTKWLEREKLFLNELPLRNWLSALSHRLLQEREHTGQLTFRCTLKPHLGWKYDGTLISVGALQVHFQCSRRWVGQVVREDVTLGYFDHLRKAVSVPSGQSYYLGWIDREAWQPIDYECEQQELAPGTFAVHLTLLNHLPPIDGFGTPSLDKLIVEQETIAVA